MILDRSTECYGNTHTNQNWGFVKWKRKEGRGEGGRRGFSRSSPSVRKRMVGKSKPRRRTREPFSMEKL